MKIIAELLNRTSGWKGILNKDGKIIAETSFFSLPKTARIALNRKIQDFNLTHETAVPLLNAKQTKVTYPQAVENVQDIAEEVQAVAENTTSDQESDQETATSVPAQVMVEMPTAFMSNLSQAITDELLKQPPQITGFIQRGETVTIYFSNGKQRKTTADRLFNINKPNQAKRKQPSNE